MICDNITVKDGVLHFAGQSTVQLAQQYGTPLYLLDEDYIRRQCRVYKAAFARHFGPIFQVQRNVIGCSSFSCQTGNRQAVRTVGSDFKFYRRIIQTNGFVNILSNLTIFLNEENAICNGIWEIMNRQAQFTERAEHTVAFYATQLALFDFHAVRQFCTAEGNRNDVASLDVWCTGYNLNRLFLSNIDLTNDQMVRVFVRNNRKQLSDDNIFDFAALFGGNFYL